jgi:peptidoglycan/LPS O-acetylase OafA/YrhL
VASWEFSFFCGTAGEQIVRARVSNRLYSWAMLTAPPTSEMVATRSVVSRASDTDSARPPYQPELDALRFFAFLAVFLFHSYRTFSAKSVNVALYDPLSFGLPVFFLLSSYLITQLLVKERAITGTVHIKAFYIRRILRIWPLYFSFLGGSYLLGIVSPRFHMEAARLLAFILLSGNWYVGAFGFGKSPIYPLWSISVEEQFYLIWPAVIMLGGRFLKPAALAIVPLSLCCIALQCVYGASVDEIWTNSGSQFLYFAAGTLAAIYFARRPITKGIAKGLVSIFCGVSAWWVIESLCHLKAQGSAPHAVPFVAGYGALAVSCFAILFGFLSLPNYLFPRWITYLGKISYGLYVFHKLCQFMVPHLRLHGVVANIAASLLGTVACAAFSYQFLEKPFLRLKERFAFVRSRVPLIAVTR